MTPALSYYEGILLGGLVRYAAPRIQEGRQCSDHYLFLEYRCEAILGGFTDRWVGIVCRSNLACFAPRQIAAARTCGRWMSLCNAEESGYLVSWNKYLGCLIPGTAFTSKQLFSSLPFSAVPCFGREAPVICIYFYYWASWRRNPPPKPNERFSTCALT